MLPPSGRFLSKEANLLEIKNYIGGRLIPPTEGNYMDNINPATGKAYSRVPRSSSRDALNAIEAAHEASEKWAATPLAKRTVYLRRMAQIIKSRLPKLAEAESMDNGKPLKLASIVDIPRASTNLEFFADAATMFSGESYPMDDTAINYTLRQPLGVVVCISPWNLPLYLLTWKIAPALAMGNAVVAKPSELTPMTAFMLSEIALEAELPDGVLNIVHGRGDDLGDTLTTHPMVEAVSFTGSTATGKKIAENASPLFKKVSLEMGGKNPNIIFEDCHFEEALKTSVHSSFSNQGQICLCGSRIFIQKSLYSKFRDQLTAKAKSLRTGNPLDPETQQGAVVSRGHYEKILSYFDLAREEGGRILCGGGPAQLGGECSKGYFIQPTVIENLSPECRTNREEIFGPVVTLTPFETEEEVVYKANGTDYGLSASIWTKDIDRAHRVARKVQSGVVWINSWMLRDLRIPFGGMKSSGMGREGGEDSLKFFTEVKDICFKVNPA